MAVAGGPAVSSAGRTGLLKQRLFEGGRGPLGTGCEEERPAQTSSLLVPAFFSHLVIDPLDTVSPPLPPPPHPTPLSDTVFQFSSVFLSR